MTHPDKDWNVCLRQNARQSVVRHRNRPVVTILTTLTVTLILAGLFADLRLSSGGLMLACYTAAALSGSALLAFLYSKRLRVIRSAKR